MILYRGDPAGHLLKAAYDLSSFGFFQRGTVQEFINMTAKILVERTQIGERQSVKEKEYTCHVFVRSDSLAGVCLSDDDYPQRVVHTMLTKIMEDFTNQVKKKISFFAIANHIFLVISYHATILYLQFRSRGICGPSQKKSMVIMAH